MTQHNVFILGMCALKALYSQVLSMSYRQGISLCSLWMKSRKKIHKSRILYEFRAFKKGYQLHFLAFFECLPFLPFSNYG